MRTVPFVLIMLSTTIAVVARDYARIAHPCHINEEKIWDLSNNELVSPPPATTKIYGDSLYSETVNNRRLWYKFINDTCIFLREETPLMGLDYGKYIQTSALGHYHQSALPIEYSISGRYSNMLNVSEEGFYEVYPAVTGQLIIATNDTLNAKMICEHRSFTAKLSTDPIRFPLDPEADSLSTYDVTRYRWFSGNDPLPIAIQTTVTEKDFCGRIISDYTTAYLIDTIDIYPEENSDEAPADAIKSILQSATVSHSGGKIIIKLSGNINFDLSIDITTPGGILYLHEDKRVMGDNELTISSSGLPSGQYVVALIFEDFVTKYLITVL